MKLDVGMYVRTEYGISKIVNIFSEKTGIFIETDNGLGNCNMSTRGKLHKGIYIFDEDFKTFIDNNVKNTIIDLIEVGDYVNGVKVDNIILKDDKEICFRYKYAFEKEDVYTLHLEDIKSIVTKEQMEAMQYNIAQCKLDFF